MAGRLGIDTNPLQHADKLVESPGHHFMKGVRLLRGLRVSFGGKRHSDVSVVLRTVVTASNAVRIQLGLDFFAQAVRASMEVELGHTPDSGVGGRGRGGRRRRDRMEERQPNSSRALTDAANLPPRFAVETLTIRDEGPLAGLSPKPNDSRDRLRFFGPDGTWASVELTHLQDTIQAGSMWWGRVKLGICGWCRVALPGLQKCGGCSSQCYCSKSCAKAAWKEHKAVCKGGSKSATNLAEGKGGE
uniref:MYND-type domain-containing protein n=1 Tax=Chromera velia CCMP2878 TaxID=1169474 RepID=A0A0G4G549_9ALVE|eukprot:Cvel_20269.t1-p1 / transcript=Cvel_20269.t1 / gene=Cvel_20269 / organism=Chromera_velia_CCMP2878 / gene_product=hypothetical protein / transcript_product=hypothetical protein / location=Cvel_scaffold1808:33884-34615(-) / protein_length=244 / sequence_SO=supercontig / SO=protein_coding / is_pseudo=false